MKMKIFILGLFIQAHLIGQNQYVSNKSELINIDYFSTIQNDEKYDPHLFGFHEYEQVNINEFEKKYSIEDAKMYTLFMVFNSNSNDTICKITSRDRLLVVENNKVEGQFPLTIDMPQKESHIFMYSGGAGRQIQKQLSNEFVIGKDPTNQANEFINIADVTLYKRILGREEKKKNESRLAIKYGIPLPVDSAYYDSELNKIFDPKSEGGFKYNVTILGNDKKLSNSQAINIRSKLLEIGIDKIQPIQKEIINDQKRYLCFADNNEDLVFEESNILNRIWKVSGDFYQFRKNKLTLKFNLKDQFDYDSRYDYFIVKSMDNSLTIYDDKELIKMTWLMDGFIVDDISSLTEEEEDVYFSILRRIKPEIQYDGLSLLGPSIAIANSPITYEFLSKSKGIRGSLSVYNNSGYELYNEGINTASHEYRIPLTIAQSGMYYVVFRNKKYHLVNKIIVQ